MWLGVQTCALPIFDSGSFEIFLSNWLTYQSLLTVKQDQNCFFKRMPFWVQNVDHFDVDKHSVTMHARTFGCKTRIFINNYGLEKFFFSSSADKLYRFLYTDSLTSSSISFRYRQALSAFKDFFCLQDQAFL